jgi:chemotaxis family two-component system response regulator Rcp1
MVEPVALARFALNSSTVMSQRVLHYVEDEDAAVFLLETALKEASINVDLYRVADGEAALAFLRKTGIYQQMPRPDLVLLDLNLPRKNGLEVLSEMRDNHELSSFAVVAVDKRKSLALGAQEYITKPASFDGFVAAVKSACSRITSGAHTA